MSPAARSITRAGYLNTTKLITTTGQIVDIGSANPNVLYRGIANSSTVSDPKWGTSTTYTTFPRPMHRDMWKARTRAR